MSGEFFSASNSDKKKRLACVCVRASDVSICMYDSAWSSEYVPAIKHTIRKFDARTDILCRPIYEEMKKTIAEEILMNYEYQRINHHSTVLAIEGAVRVVNDARISNSKRSSNREYDQILMYESACDGDSVKQQLQNIHFGMDQLQIPVIMRYVCTQFTRCTRCTRCTRSCRSVVFWLACLFVVFVCPT